MLQKKKFSKCAYYSHIRYGYNVYIQWYVLKKEIKIFSDSKHSRFHCVLQFYFFFCCGVEVKFFLLFLACFGGLFSFCVHETNEQRTTVTPPTLLFMNREHWSRLMRNNKNFLHYSGETICAPQELLELLPPTSKLLHLNDLYCLLSDFS